MRPVAALASSLLGLVMPAPSARALGETRVTLEEALRASQRAAPDLLVARAREFVAHAEIGVAGVYPNPSLSAATSTQAAKVSGTVSIPLIVLGQRGAAIDAARAAGTTVFLDTQVAWNDVRNATVRAYTALWLSEGVVEARRESAALEAKLEASVVQRVEVGSAPQIEALRVHAERLRADADVLEAFSRMEAAGSELGRWMGIPDGGVLRAARAPAVPDVAPSLASLLLRLDAGVSVRREQSDVYAADLRTARERALVRPGIFLDLGFDALDRSLNPPDATNYRAQVSMEVPIFNQRGAAIQREQALSDVARARVRAARALASAELTASYRMLEAASARERVLVDAVVPAARAAAQGTQEAYTLGRAPLVAVLDAERALVDTQVSALDAEASRADAWAGVEHALGGP